MKTVNSPNRRRFLLRGLLTGGALCALGYLDRAVAMDEVMAGHEHHHHHEMPTKSDGYIRAEANYRIPDVSLLDIQGEPVALNQLLNDGKPVMMNFIFTSCGAICPVMSATFSEVQSALGPARKDLHMVSISIDPEYDTPAVLKTYAEHFGADAQWQMLTGSLDSSVAVQRAFGVYRGDKMDHSPLTFLRGKPGQPWLRLEGFASADDLLREYRRIAAN